MSLAPVSDGPRMKNPVAVGLAIFGSLAIVIATFLAVARIGHLPAYRAQHPDSARRLGVDRIGDLDSRSRLLRRPGEVSVSLWYLCRV